MGLVWFIVWIAVWLGYGLKMAIWFVVLSWQRPGGRGLVRSAGASDSWCVGYGEDPPHFTSDPTGGKQAKGEPHRDRDAVEDDRARTGPR